MPLAPQKQQQCSSAHAAVLRTENRWTAGAFISQGKGGIHAGGGDGRREIEEKRTEEERRGQRRGKYSRKKTRGRTEGDRGKERGEEKRGEMTGDNRRGEDKGEEKRRKV